MNARTSDLRIPAGSAGCGCGRCGGGSGCGCEGGCGCNGRCGCDSRCCDLECLVRPNYFCGQMLADTDLSALVDWSRSRFALGRYREGWGIVCGLDVSCSVPGDPSPCCDPQSGPRVYLHPGYAVDCCGTDLVVCEPTPIDLSSACRPPEDACQPAATARPRQRPSEDDQDCWKAITRGLFAVDLTLRYDEKLSHGQRAMFRSGCADDGACEYARILEQPTVHLAVKSLEAHGDEEPPYQKWETELRQERLRQWERIGAVTRELEEMLRYVRRHPPYRFCFLEELICCLLKEGGREEGWRKRIRLWLFLDWLIHELECRCFSCRREEGVPIARVLLSRKVVLGKTVCKVVWVETGPRHRRFLRKEPCRPLPEGGIDLTGLLGQSRRDVEARLVALGVSFEHSEFEIESEAAQERVIGSRLTLEPGAARKVRAVVTRDPFNDERVVAFE